MHHSLIKRIILLSLAFFFSAGVAIAFHHYDNTFLLAARSICKTKAATSGTMGKNKSDPTTAVTVISVGGVVFPLLTTVVAESTTIFMFSQSGYIWPNKAPPIQS
jgi:uncharacterized membrane protein YadS